MSKKELVEKFLSQISGQHAALLEAHAALLRAHEAGTDFDLEKLEEAASLYWRLREVMGRLTSGGAVDGDIDLDFV